MGIKYRTRTGIDNDTSNGGSMATDPFGRAVHCVYYQLWVAEFGRNNNEPTISAPCSMGLMRYPPIPKVLSTIKGMP